LSVPRAGIFLFIGFDLFLVHGAGTYRPDVTAPVTLPDSEHNEDGGPWSHSNPKAVDS
jgi:hypothetical protein